MRFANFVTLNRTAATLIAAVSLSFGMDISPTQASGSVSAERPESAVHYHGNVCIDNPWAFDSLGKNVAAVFMVLSAREGFSDSLLRASSAQAGNVMLHDSVIEDGVMMMRHAERLSFDSSTPLVLQPNGLHVMLMGMKSALTPQSDLQVELEFEKSGPIAVDVEVRPLADGPPEHAMRCK